MATPTASEHRDLEQRFRDLEQRTRDLATVGGRRTSRTVTVDQSFSPVGFSAGNAAEAAGINIPVPDGFTAATVLLVVTAGASFGSSSRIGAQAVVDGDAGRLSAAGGNTSGAIHAVTASKARTLTSLGANVRVRVDAYASSADNQVSSTYVNLSAVVTFTR